MLDIKRTRKNVKNIFFWKSLKDVGGERGRLPLKNGNWIQFALFCVDPVYGRRRDPFCKVREKRGRGKDPFFLLEATTRKKRSSWGRTRRYIGNGDEGGEKD